MRQCSTLKMLYRRRNLDWTFAKLSLCSRCYNSTLAGHVYTKDARLDTPLTSLSSGSDDSPGQSKSKEPMRTSNLQPGSRRSRAALQSCLNAPFEKLPYQCFQEARKILRADREEKVQQILKERQRIARLLAQDNSMNGGDEQKSRRLNSMRKHLETLKIYADINDPLVKKRFEDGQGKH